MTHSTKCQTRPSLSVRTRASIHKTHAQIVSRHGFPWKRIQMRLRNRIASDTERTCRFDLSDSPSTDLSSDSRHSASQNSQAATQPSQNRADEISISQHDSLSYLPSSSSGSVSSDSTSGSACKWEGCGILIEPSQLITHIQQVHVLPQFLSCRRKCFTCLWRGCRVFRQPSVSAAWLEQHILHHTDAKGKPFRCIFDSCALRFSTSMLLERHVQRCHIRTTRARAVAQTCTEPTAPTPLDESCASEPLPLCGTDPVVNQSPSEICKPSHLPPSTNGKKCLKRRRKLRCYRVRRVDFYDSRSQCVVQHRLKILSLLNRSGPKLPVDAYSHTRSDVRGHESCPTVIPQLTLPKPLYKTSPNTHNKTRLRTTIHCNQEAALSEAIPSKTITSRTDPSDRIKQLRNVALLLTMPHTIIGQRLSDDRHTEFLVRWLGDSEMTHLPPMWISEDHLRAAQTFGEL